MVVAAVLFWIFNISSLFEGLFPGPLALLYTNSWNGC